jgi:hypothetical protein
VCRGFAVRLVGMRYVLDEILLQTTRRNFRYEVSGEPQHSLGDSQGWTSCLEESTFFAAMRTHICQDWLASALPQVYSAFSSGLR